MITIEEYRRERGDVLQLIFEQRQFCRFIEKRMPGVNFTVLRQFERGTVAGAQVRLWALRLVSPARKRLYVHWR